MVEIDVGIILVKYCLLLSQRCRFDERVIWVGQRRSYSILSAVEKLARCLAKVVLIEWCTKDYVLPKLANKRHAEEVSIAAKSGGSFTIPWLGRMNCGVAIVKVDLFEDRRNDLEWEFVDMHRAFWEDAGKALFIKKRAGLQATHFKDREQFVHVTY